ncbi:hypothetical protein ASE98_04675 [Pseudomonas sp. Leaf48]|nr:hypothetical protein ASE98_04675 [Pseudomonas sp. Leaf48]
MPGLLILRTSGHESRALVIREEGGRMVQAVPRHAISIMVGSESMSAIMFNATSSLANVRSISSLNPTPPPGVTSGTPASSNRGQSSCSALNLRPALQDGILRDRQDVEFGLNNETQRAFGAAQHTIEIEPITLFAKMRQVITGEAAVQFRKGTLNQICLIIRDVYRTPVNLTDPIMARSLLLQSWC